MLFSFFYENEYIILNNYWYSISILRIIIIWCCYSVLSRKFHCSIYMWQPLHEFLFSCITSTYVKMIRKWRHLSLIHNMHDMAFCWWNLIDYVKHDGPWFIVHNFMVAHNLLLDFWNLIFIINISMLERFPAHRWFILSFNFNMQRKVTRKKLQQHEQKHELAKLSACQWINQLVEHCCCCCCDVIDLTASIWRHMYYKE